MQIRVISSQIPVYLTRYFRIRTRILYKVNKWGAESLLENLIRASCALLTVRSLVFARSMQVFE